MAKEKILIVEDTEDIRDLLKLYLEPQGFTVIEAGSAEEGLERFERESPDLALLDIVLPDMDGYEVCRRIRSVSKVPIVFISCNTSSSDIVRGLELGGDDYIEKPFDPAVVVARVQANLRRVPLARGRGGSRPPTAAASEVIHIGGLEIDPPHLRVNTGSATCTLTVKEMQLLVYLAAHPNRVFAPDQLYKEVWGSDSVGDTRTIFVHISSIRKKIEPDPAHPMYLMNIRGSGYMFRG
ncbi:DNA-binding response regulator, OmpR family, contains REC and winged-helix (wHTH) domain [Paenibacillus sp. UNCCL117]|uniref:response regulator transcription factor n=1 Tax=unclassified Paenibacillus TaxID=185978 RepID=UPI000884B4E8|nr:MULTISPECIES: response regulator transcription factor [unclassified Paenibacillus]SDD18789.1 DNA-binding response regulator, OmpR family, contains REC and winged-helix (wHTH) domain [Paenibacillus sp. cl123]SFW35320.1 DNA-binding response regulator, OmpR family, contains REC and winged-helix (wHTH) domain [Paenibacillus sp. UNCCL117]